MLRKPQILINVFIFNSTGDKMLIGKRLDVGLYSLLYGKLKFGEDFEESGQRLLAGTANIKIQNPERIKFVCSYNVIDKILNNHYISIALKVNLTKDEEKSKIYIDPYIFKSWDWFDFEQVKKLNLYIALQQFFNRYKIKSLKDIDDLESA